jgi:hypothetical protein
LRVIDARMFLILKIGYTQQPYVSTSTAEETRVDQETDGQMKIREETWVGLYREWPARQALEAAV